MTKPKSVTNVVINATGELHGLHIYGLKRHLLVVNFDKILPIIILINKIYIGKYLDYTQQNYSHSLMCVIFLIE